jgi:hypothetical protein
MLHQQNTHNGMGPPKRGRKGGEGERGMKDTGKDAHPFVGLLLGMSQSTRESPFVQRKRARSAFIALSLLGSASYSNFSEARNGWRRLSPSSVAILPVIIPFPPQNEHAAPQVRVRIGIWFPHRKRTVANLSSLDDIRLVMET